MNIRQSISILFSSLAKKDEFSEESAEKALKGIDQETYRKAISFWEREITKLLGFIDNRSSRFNYGTELITLRIQNYMLSKFFFDEQKIKELQLDAEISKKLKVLLQSSKVEADLLITLEKKAKILKANSILLTALTKTLWHFYEIFKIYPYGESVLEIRKETHDNLKNIENISLNFFECMYVSQNTIPKNENLKLQSIQEILTSLIAQNFESTLPEYEEFISYLHKQTFYSLINGNPILESPFYERLLEAAYE